MEYKLSLYVTPPVTIAEGLSKSVEVLHKFLSMSIEKGGTQAT